MNREKQRNLEKIREKLAAQLQQKVSDEDERIRKAVEEAEEKRAKEEAEKEAKMLKGMEESAKHRNKQVSLSSWQPSSSWSGKFLILSQQAICFMALRIFSSELFNFIKVQVPTTSVYSFRLLYPHEHKSMM